MKAIIKGRGYVTDNAELLGEVTLNGARTGLKWWSAGLYRIPRGMLLPRRRGQLHDRMAPPRR